ncbi:MAG: TonB-dependent receptor [Vicinamibacteria bacterium]
MASRRNLLVAFLAFVVACGLPRDAQAQDGRVHGVVRDSSGAGLPGATVTATNQATGATLTATSGADGSYDLSVPAGTYSVAVTLKGFGRKSHRDLKVEPGASATSDFTLDPRREEEVTVTAMKREGTVQETPFSIAAPTEADLRSRGIDDIEGVARDVAGFSVQNLGPGQSQVAIRGVSSGQIARDQPGVKEQVAAYLDESVISLSLFTPDLDLFDVSRMEVLRGPQGTLFGSGNVSGTVRYISNQPEIGVKKVFGEFGGNSIDGGSQGGNLKLGFNAPLGDKAAVRVAGYYSHLAGYMDTPGITRTSNGSIRPDPGSEVTDVNSGDRFGVRAALRILPSQNLTITPRIVYQKVEMDGWNRIDDFNILANPFTTTRPAVTLGDRRQFVQIDEPFTDEFTLGDLTLGYAFGGATLTSITSYTNRDVLVVRDAGALTSSITGGSIGLPEPIYSIDAPLDDATEAKVWTQELRLSGAGDKLKWVLGGFYSDTTRDYGQSLLVAGFEDASGIPTAGSRGAGKDILFYSDLHYELSQFALFGEATLTLNDRIDLTAGLRYYDFNEDRTQVFDGIFADPSAAPASTDASGVAPRLIATFKVSPDTNINAQVAKGFRLGGINDPLNVPLCTPADLVTFGGRDSWEDETAWNYELGSKSRVMGGRGSLNVSAFYIDIQNLQATVTAGSCSSRVIFNVPESRSAGGEIEFAAAPSDSFDFSLSAAFNDSQIRSTLTSTAADGTTSVVAGIREGNRLPSVPQFQMSATATYQWQMRGDWRGYLTGTYQHVGSRYTQVGDEEPGAGVVNLLSFGAGTIGAPLTASTFTFDPEMPSYDIVNARLGVLVGRWDLALYANNLTDETAFLALDRERGQRARVGYLTNQPRTFGLSARVTF